MGHGVKREFDAPRSASEFPLDDWLEVAEVLECGLRKW